MKAGEVWEWLHDPEVVFVVLEPQRGRARILYLSHDDPSKVGWVRVLEHVDLSERDHRRIG